MKLPNQNKSKAVLDKTLDFFFFRLFLVRKDPNLRIHKEKDQ